jgi:hypothetical protein
MSSDNERILAALADPKNEPINWLLGAVLRAGLKKGDSHVLIDALAGRRHRILELWNAWIAEFRTLITNPDVAVTKAKELSSKPLCDIKDFITEVFAVLHLSRNGGYSQFEVVLGSNKPLPDFVARKNGKRVRIEVKNLHEPGDIIRTIAKERLLECRSKNPDKYNFSISVEHSYHSPLSEAAMSRLKNAIDELPDVCEKEHKIVLDGGIKVTLKRLDEEAIKASGDEGAPLSEMLKHAEGTPRFIVESPIRISDLEFNLSDLQLLFVKAFRIVGDAAKKFFGRQSDPDAENIMVMRWEPPLPMYDEQTPKIVGEAIGKAFAAVGLELTVIVLGSDPEPNFSFLP